MFTYIKLDFSVRVPLRICNGWRIQINPFSFQILHDSVFKWNFNRYDFSQNIRKKVYCYFFSSLGKRKGVLFWTRPTTVQIKNTTRVSPITPSFVFDSYTREWKKGQLTAQLVPPVLPRSVFLRFYPHKLPANWTADAKTADNGGHTVRYEYVPLSVNEKKIRMKSV